MRTTRAGSRSPASIWSWEYIQYRPRNRWRRCRWLSRRSHSRWSSNRAGAAAGAGGNGRDAEWCDAVGVTAAGQQVYRLDLADVRVTNVEHDAGAGLTLLTLGYGQIELETFTPNGTGSVVPEGPVRLRCGGQRGRRRPAEHASERERRCEPAARELFHAHRRGQRRLDGRAAQGWFEITGFDLDLAHATVLGGGTGPADFSPLNVTLPHETRLADVMELAATGRHVRCTHRGITGGATPTKVYDLTLADVAVTKVADGEDDSYNLSLDYGKIALIIKGIDATGPANHERRIRLRRRQQRRDRPVHAGLNPNGHQAPDAVDDSAFIKEDTSPNQVLGNVLSNDQDVMATR